MGKNSKTQSNYATLIGLVSQYSPSGSERNAVDWLVSHMKIRGFTQTFVDEAGNAVGIMGTGKKQVMLLGHIDTVPGEIEIVQDGNNLYGRGSVDAKGPLACFVDTIARIGPKEGWQFVVIGAVEEERNSEGARFVVQQYNPDFAIIGEPNRWNRVALGYKGSAWANIIIRGGKTHSASGKITAAESGVEAWLKIRGYADTYNGDKKKLFDKLLVSLSSIESGSDDFEEWVKLKIGVRLPVEVNPSAWYQILDTIVKTSTDFEELVEPTGIAIPAWKSEKNTALVRSFLKGIRQNGGEPSFVYKTGTADVNIVTLDWNCPAVVYGPGDSKLDHTPHEYISLDEYTQAADVLVTTIEVLIQYSRSILN
jgi:[amino group carrier protein]-lysine/ornithine hydrolase